MKLYLIGLDKDHSTYIRELINQDRLKNCDTNFINNKISKYRNEIKKLEDLKKQGSINQEKINKILNFHAKHYQENALRRTENQKYNFLKKTIMPQIKRFGYKGTIEELDQVLLNWSEKDV